MNMAVSFPVTLSEQIEAVEREIGMRSKLYPRWVAAQKMSEQKSARELQLMRAVLATLKELREDERIL